MFTTMWRLDYKNRRVYFIKGSCDNGLRVDTVMPWMVRASHRKEQARVAKQVFKKARNARMYGDLDIEKDMLFLVKAEGDMPDEEHVRLFAEREDAELWVLLSKLEGETPPLKLVSVEPISVRVHTIKLGLKFITMIKGSQSRNQPLSKELDSVGHWDSDGIGGDAPMK